MSSPQSLVEDYLARLRHASADLPDGPRHELVDQITDHLAETTGDGADVATVRSVLDDLGSPEEIAAAARAESGTRAVDPGRTSGQTLYDVGAVLVLLLGGFVVPVLGWVAGVVMLWVGPRWTATQKWVGTLLWPVAVLAAGGVLVGLRGARTGDQLGLLFWLVVVPVVVAFPVVAVYLLRAAGRRGADLP